MYKTVVWLLTSGTGTPLVSFTSRAKLAAFTVVSLGCLGDDWRAYTGNADGPLYDATIEIAQYVDYAVARGWVTGAEPVPVSGPAMMQPYAELIGRLHRAKRRNVCLRKRSLRSQRQLAVQRQVQQIMQPDTLPSSAPRRAPALLSHR